jgi:uncharacterized membrane protein required for colicin V production
VSCLRYLCLFAYSGVQHILCCVFVYVLSLSSVPYVASFSGLSIFDYPFGVLLSFFVTVKPVQTKP